MTCVAVARTTSTLRTSGCVRRRVAHNLKLPDDNVESVRTAGRLHDLGMIGIREGVLNKTSQLTKEEFEHVKQHVAVGSQILAPLKHLGPIVRYV